MFLDRLIRNWKTTMAALIPAIVAVGIWLGFEVDPAKLTAITSAIYVIILLFAKDQPPKE